MPCHAMPPTVSALAEHALLLPELLVPRGVGDGRHGGLGGVEGVDGLQGGRAPVWGGTSYRSYIYKNLVRKAFLRSESKESFPLK